ncbi:MULTISPECIES: metallophosphoesterase family protein [unclassified Solwaraspora]|uniref:metallophosphoesterase family protein n=1 Tax=unclassified Solwaraspora TaxID=2627926 RepID=UPI00259BDE36|nr:metallophosphoesterase [Solwaraspora sp. WMMA2056]WJK38819.1 metallophosphoesterase [Solwaraspora sp. WMMA2056]
MGASGTDGGAPQPVRTPPGPGDGAAAPTLWAISDLHISYQENRQLVADLAAPSPDDWLIVAGDVAETIVATGWALGTLRQRFAQVIWSPGNHELWTTAREPSGPRGVERYQQLVELCRALDVRTPEDPYLQWTGAGGPAVVAPLFTLYDYSFLPAGTSTKEQGLAYAYGTGIVCTDESMLHPDPFPSREQWCWQRLDYTAQRLSEVDPHLPTVLVNHYPLVRDPMNVLRYPEFAMWCGTERTADWHVRFRASVMVYGHLHIPRTTWYDGVRFEEVSVGYPREWRQRPGPPAQLRRILPHPAR